MRIALVGAYLAIIGALLYFVKAPWNYAAAGLVLLKGLIFMAVSRQAGTIGMRRRLPPTQ